MRVVKTNVLQFHELSEQAQEKAIGSIRAGYYINNDFASWAVDDCALFEPAYVELEKLGFDFKKHDILMKNTRKEIYFDTDRNSFLNIDKALVITDEKIFLSFLGIPEKLQEKIVFNVAAPYGRDRSTEIDFDVENDFLQTLSKEEEDILQAAKDKFSAHVSAILKRIEAAIEYNFTDEAIKEHIETNEIEFTEDGTPF